jgi:hypothetical protein
LNFAPHKSQDENLQPITTATETADKREYSTNEVGHLMPGESIHKGAWRKRNSEAWD